MHHSGADIEARHSRTEA